MNAAFVHASVTRTAVPITDVHVPSPPEIRLMVVTSPVIFRAVLFLFEPQVCEENVEHKTENTLLKVPAFTRILPDMRRPLGSCQ